MALSILTTFSVSAAGLRYKFTQGLRELIGQSDYSSSADWKIKPFYVMWKMPESQTEKSGSMDSAPGVLVHALPRKKGTLGYPQSRRKNASSNFFVEHSLCLNNQIVLKIKQSFCDRGD